MSRQELAKIPALIFYQNDLTTSRRTSPMPQLICVGKPCRLYTPDVVRCVNLGGSGTEVDWKCEADLPESLRFGRVEVSCEGWSRPGDPYVLKGSCSLEYRLVKVDGSLMDSPLFPSRSWFKSTNISELIFMILWVAFLVFIAYSFLKPCFSRNTRRATQRPRPGGSGWFPGGPRDNYPSPPPYSKNPADPVSGWAPGFWTGAALGGLGTYMMSGRRTDSTEPRMWDWERVRNSPSSMFGRRRVSPQVSPHSEDRGEGSSNLGAMRRSTGFGGSSVR